MSRALLLGMVVAGCNFSGAGGGGGGDPDASGDAASIDGAVDGPVAASCAPAANLVACYDFESDVTDGSGSGNDGSSVGAPSFAPGHDGLAIVLDGVDDSATIAEDNSLDVSSLTIDAWISMPILAGLGEEQVIFDNHSQWALSVFEDTASCTAGGGTLITAGVLSAGTFHHIACTADQNEVRLFLDGVQVACDDRDGNGLVTSGSRGSAIGADVLGSGALTGFFAGSIDMLRIRNVVQSQNDICLAAGQTPPCQILEQCGD